MAITPLRDRHREWRGPLLCHSISCAPLAMPGELLRLAGRALRQHDVDQGGAGEGHRLVEGFAYVLRLLDDQALAAEGLHHLVVARAEEQPGGLPVEHRVRRNLRD